MELLVIAGEDLVRSGGRLAAVLSRGHNAMMLTLQDYQLSAAPGPDVRVIFLGQDGALINDAEAQTVYQQHGISIQIRGNSASILGLPVSDPRATLKSMGRTIEALNQRHPMVKNPMEDKTTPRNGAGYASLFLNPKLRVPTQTVASSFTFSSERMCWERQYTLGIAQFLATGFDPWLHHIGVR